MIITNGKINLTKTEKTYYIRALRMLEQQLATSDSKLGQRNAIMSYNIVDKVAVALGVYTPEEVSQ